MVTNIYIYIYLYRLALYIVRYRSFNPKLLPGDEVLLPLVLVELSREDDEDDEDGLIGVVELDDEELVFSTGDDVELNVDDVISVDEVTEIGVDDETDDVCVLEVLSSSNEDDELAVVDVISVVGVTVLEVDGVDVEELSSSGGDVELVLDDEVDEEPMSRMLLC